MSKENASAKGRTRNWVFIVYPESAPKNWRDILDDFHIEWVESPLHDSDKNDAGELKKPHWHVLLMFEGVKSVEQVKEVSEAVLGTIPIKCNSPKGTVRYMAHLDNPEKHQYDKSKIIAHGGADVGELLKPTSSARYMLIREMSEFIRDNDVREYEDLYFYAMEYRFDDWFPILCDSGTYVLDSLLRSRRNRIREEAEKERERIERQKRLDRYDIP